MSFLGNLFKSKTCAICYAKMGMTEQKELANGAFICNKCADKLSKWFTTDARKHSTPKQISDQIVERRKNEMEIIKFQASRIIGRSIKVYLDEPKRKFMVVETDNPKAENADVLNASDIINVMTNIHETKHELFDRDNNGRTIPFNPRRYDYSYNFIVTIDMRHPYCTHRRFKVNDKSIWVRYEYLQSRGMSGFASAISSKGNLMDNIFGAMANGIANSIGGDITSSYPPEYNEYRQIMEDIRSSLISMRSGVQSLSHSSNPMLGNSMGAIGGIQGHAPNMIQTRKWFCPKCGAENSANYCQYCGTKKTL